MARKKANVYFGSFGSWRDVVREFCGISPYDKDYKNVLRVQIKSIGKPSEVFYANYNNEDYDGCAFVLWRKGRKYYTLYGSHCSCYGLEEGGWDPSEWTKKTLIGYLEKGGYISYAFPDEDRLRILKKLKRKVKKKSVQNVQVPGLATA